ncbi:ATPase F0F1 [uncultured Selenomonas sp.]|uniref:ATPase F0F1 n=1 Tax=uncultured Selenomonas sp. TaxID=159275 RepID=UPI0028DC8DA5|nr:ATPase F0F1 [uncultured Selenomonas sp.]
MERETKSKEKGALRQALDAYLFLSGLGIFFCVVLGISMYVGHLADEAFSLGHKGIFAGILVGFPLALFSVYRRVRQMR